MNTQELEDNFIEISFEKQQTEQVFRRTNHIILVLEPLSLAPER